MMTNKKWTVMFYLAGDNNLSEEMISSLRGMQKAMRGAGSDEEINLIAIYDSGYPTAEITSYHFTRQNSDKNLKDCVYQSRHARQSKERKRYDDTAHIPDFVAAVAADERFAAENYALILSGHSDAVLGKTMFRDANPETTLHLSLLAKILSESVSSLKNIKKFAVVGFDSCMMGMLEVGCELADSTEFMIASQGFAPTDGWDYEEVLKNLVARQGQLTPEEFAVSIVNNQIDSSKNYCLGGRSMNLSAVDLSTADDLKKSINSLARVFNEIFDAPVEVSERNPKETAEMNAVIAESVKHLIQESHYYAQTFLHEQAVDVLDFVNALDSKCHLKLKEIEVYAGNAAAGETAARLQAELDKIQKQCQDIRAKVRNYVKANRASGAEYQFSEGVSVFFPWTMLAFNMVYARYRQLRFSDDPEENEWFEFLEKFTNLTYRANGEPKFDRRFDYLQWKSEVAALNKANTAKDSEQTRANTAKANTAKGESELFYKFFGRFRNHPIYHDFVK